MTQIQHYPNGPHYAHYFEGKPKSGDKAICGFVFEEDPHEHKVDVEECALCPGCLQALADTDLTSVKETEGTQLFVQRAKAEAAKKEAGIKFNAELAEKARRSTNEEAEVGDQP